MKEVIIKTQKEIDNLKDDQEGYVYIEGGTEAEPLVFTKTFKAAEVIVRGSAYLDVGGSATIRYVGGSATIGDVRDSATIGYVGGSATIGYVGGSATIGDVGGSATIRYVGGSATISLSGEAVISAHSAKAIVCSGYNTIIVHKADRKKIGLIMSKTSHLVVLPDNTLHTKPTFKEYAIRYPVLVKGAKAIMYKAVHKIGDKFVADYSSAFEYAIGETKMDTCAPAASGACSYGLHVAHKGWALSFGAGWDNMALLECEVAVKDIVVSTDTDGKVRTSKLKVLREVPPEEYWK
jgi:hypothetical protein